MCGICGCESTTHEHTDQSHHPHSHHSHDHAKNEHAAPETETVQQELSSTRLIDVEARIQARNDSYAEQIRTRLAANQVWACNLLSSPGAGKTTLLVETINALQPAIPLMVIEGDQQTDNDAQRIRQTGTPAVQINTGKGCHLDAHAVLHQLDHPALTESAILFIENVGNLICPAAFDLGEQARVCIISVTEGDDKPLKYPDAVLGSDLLIISKTDLAPYVDFDIGRCATNARKINPKIDVITLSAKTGEGITPWIDWIKTSRQHYRQTSTLLTA